MPISTYSVVTTHTRLNAEIPFYIMGQEYRTVLENAISEMGERMISSRVLVIDNSQIIQWIFVDEAAYAEFQSKLNSNETYVTARAGQLAHNSNCGITTTTQVGIGAG